ncbi:MAG TPA: peptidoglycan-binding domain-containing protein [Phycicoccus elongatus]|nr:peptidoglycan-binding domain-containing protein [Phycicoccus elongatus]
MAILALVLVVLAGVFTRFRQTGALSEAATPTWAMTTVSRQTLAIRSVLEGSLDYGTPVNLPIRAEGTITWLPAPGTIVRRGEPLMRVDDRPVVLLYGALPMYRDVGPAPLVAAVGTGTGTAVGTGTTPASVPPMVGNDVAELESNLKALGYTGFTVDTTFGGGTKAAVKKWQHEIGVPETGQVLRGDVAVLPGPVRIGPPLVQLGAPASAEALTYTGLDLVVSATASTGDPSWTTAGASATILGADGRRVDGVLTVPATTSAATGASSSASILVVPKDPRALDGLEPGRALVERVSAQHDNVLAVPVEALVALAEGGYGLQLADGEAAHFVAVQTGLFSNAMVEVSGPQVTEGLLVRVPR